MTKYAVVPVVTAMQYDGTNLKEIAREMGAIADDFEVDGRIRHHAWGVYDLMPGVWIVWSGAGVHGLFEDEDTFRAHFRVL